MKDWTYFALDERVCLAPCAPFIMLPMFESAARFPAGANPWLLKPTRFIERTVGSDARQSVSPLARARSAHRHPSRNARVALPYLLSSRRGRYARASRFRSSLRRSWVCPLRRRPRRRRRRRRRQYLGVAIIVTAFPSIHPSTSIHSRIHPSIHPSIRARDKQSYRARRRRRSPFSSAFVDARRTAVE